jgi:hypothetical protein
VFDKKEASKTFDEADNFNDRRSIVYARNAVFDLAENVGVRYFIQLDDDYTSFRYARHPTGKYITSSTDIKSLDGIFGAMVTFVKKSGVDSIAMAQGGDFFGQYIKRFETKGWNALRKCMNSFVCDTENRFQFVGRINEDVNTYTNKASTGKVFLTIPAIRLEQKQTQTNAGGMSDIYADNGTYIKSFYTVIFSPSCCKVAMLKSSHQRLHHKINWNNAVPKIMSEEHKKNG